MPPTPLLGKSGHKARQGPGEHELWWTYPFWRCSFPPNSRLLKVRNALSRCLPWCWIVCPLLHGSWLPWCPLIPFATLLGRCVCASHLDGVSAFPRVDPPSQGYWLPMSALDSQRYPSWMVCRNSRRSWLPILGWCVRLPLSPFLDGGSACFCLPLYPCLFPFVGQCVRLPEGLVSLCLALFLACFPLLDGVSAFPRVLSPFVFIGLFLVSLRWMQCPPSRGSCLPLSPIVPFLVAHSVCC